MRQLTYAMQFKGQASPGAMAGSLQAKSSSPSCRFTATISSYGLTASIDSEPGDSAAFESNVTFTGDASFQESGTIAFGEGHRLSFSTVGSGFLGASADPKIRQGTVTWKVDSGEGQFEGASGLITSNFTVDDAGQVVDNHLGVIFLK